MSDTSELHRSAMRFVDATAGTAAGAAFAALSFLRRRRVFHPEGIALEATLEVGRGHAFGAALLDEPGRRRCIVRVSRGVGLPEGSPDILGVAVRVLADDGETPAQDLLFTTVLSESAVGRFVLAPSSRFDGRPYTTVLPYRTPDGVLLLGLRADRAGPPPSTTAGAAAALERGELSFELLVLAGTGAPTVVGRLTGGRRLPDEVAEALHLNPFHAAADLQPDGAANRVRRKAYAGSQAGRPS